MKISLSWTPGVGNTAFNVYRGSTAGGPYSKLTDTPITSPAFDDSAIKAGDHFFYVVTGLDATGAESPFSNEASASVPAAVAAPTGLSAVFVP